MGKRLIRIFHEEFGSKLNSISGKEINIVLIDNTTLHGICIRMDRKNLLFKDSRDIQHSIPMDSISEIIYDIQAAY